MFATLPQPDRKRQLLDAPGSKGKDNQEQLTRRWSRLAITSCGMVRLLAASCSTFSFAHRDQSQSRDCPGRVGVSSLVVAALPRVALAR
jgi:hypothetical protein